MSAGDAASDGPVLCGRPDGRAKNLLIGNVIKVQFLNIRDGRLVQPPALR